MGKIDLRYVKRNSMLYYKQALKLKIFDTIVADSQTTELSSESLNDALQVNFADRVLSGESLEKIYDTQDTGVGHIGVPEILASDFKGTTDIHIWSEDDVDNGQFFEPEEVITNRQGNFYYATQEALPIFATSILRKDELSDEDYIYLYEFFTRSGILSSVSFDPLSKVQIKVLWTLLKDLSILVLLTVLTLHELKKTTHEKELNFICKRIKEAAPFISYPVVQVFVAQLKEPPCIKQILHAILQEKDTDYARKVLANLFNTRAFISVVIKLRNNEYKEAISKVLKRKLKNTLNLLSLLAEGVNFEALMYTLSDFDFRVLKNELYTYFAEK